MKSTLYALLLSFILFSCKQKDNGKTVIARPLSDKEDFNQFSKDSKNVLSIFQQNDSLIKKRADRVSNESFHVKFADTTLSIQMNAADKNSVIDKFSFAEFLNTQKTSMLVQPADSSGLVAPFYIITVNKDKLEVVNLYRPSGGSNDSKYAKGATVVGRSGYVINNDFFVTSVSAKVYPIKRIKEEERIHGLFLINSPDKQTIVFMMPSSLYEVHYSTGEVFTQPLPSSMPTEPASVYKWIQDKYSWQKNESGITFLKKNIDEDRIIDIGEFKK